MNLLLGEESWVYPVFRYRSIEFESTSIAGTIVKFQNGFP